MGSRDLPHVNLPIELRKEREEYRTPYRHAERRKIYRYKYKHKIELSMKGEDRI